MCKIYQMGINYLTDISELMAQLFFFLLSKFGLHRVAYNIGREAQSASNWQSKFLTLLFCY